MEQGLIGVVVPVYKVEKYIAECIESILAQTYANFRLILVDDGSPDNAGKICDEYAKKDTHITVIHQENAGVTRARARGVEEAADCEFITFVDGDDSIIPTALFDLIQTMNSNTDIVITNRILEYENIDEPTISNDDYQTRLITEKISCVPWSRLFRRNLFDNSVFDISNKIIVSEDLIANIRLACNSNREIAVLHKNIYNYRINQEGLTLSHKETADLYYHIYTALKDSYKGDSLKIHIVDIIKRFLNRWDRKFGYSYETPDWNHTELQQVLVSDIRKYGYKKDFFAKLLLKIEKPSVRYVVILLRKICNKLFQ